MQLDEVNALVEKRASAGGIADKWEVQDAKDLFRCVFSRSENDSWRHAPESELRSGADRVTTNDVAESARHYMKLGWLQDEALDWLLADAITFGEVNSTFKIMSPTRRYFLDGAPVTWMFAANIVMRLVFWAIWLLALLLLYSDWDSDSHVMAGALVVVTVAYQWAKRTREQRVWKLLLSMSAAYGALDSYPPSWRNFYALIEKSRDAGAKWPTELYRLVEKNLER